MDFVLHQSWFSRFCLHPGGAALYVEKGKGDTPKACGKRNKGKKEKEKKERKKKKENYQNTI